jgi:hypothetical protein
VPVRLFDIEELDVSDHVVDLAEPKLRHDLPKLFCDPQQILHDAVGCTCEASPQLRILGRNADGAGVEVAHAHEDAPHGDKGCRRKAVFIGAEQRRDGDISAGLQSTIGLHLDATPQVVHDQGLLGLRESDLPGEPRVLDGGLGRCTRSAVHPGNQHAVGLPLGDSRRDGSHAGNRHQLD